MFFVRFKYLNLKLNEKYQIVMFLDEHKQFFRKLNSYIPWKTLKSGSFDL